VAATAPWFNAAMSLILNVFWKILTSRLFDHLEDCGSKKPANAQAD
jgi:hypothetical protein